MIITLVESSSKERHLNQSRKVIASIVDLSIPAPHLCSLLLPAVLAVFSSPLLHPNISLRRFTFCLRVLSNAREVCLTPEQT